MNYDTFLVLNQIRRCQEYIELARKELRDASLRIADDKWKVSPEIEQRIRDITRVLWIEKRLPDGTKSGDGMLFDIAIFCEPGEKL